MGSEFCFLFGTPHKGRLDDRLSNPPSCIVQPPYWWLLLLNSLPEFLDSILLYGHVSSKQRAWTFAGKPTQAENAAVDYLRCCYAEASHFQLSIPLLTTFRTRTHPANTSSFQFHPRRVNTLSLFEQRFLPGRTFCKTVLAVMGDRLIHRLNAFHVNVGSFFEASFLC